MENGQPCEKKPGSRPSHRTRQSSTSQKQKNRPTDPSNSRISSRPLSTKQAEENWLTQLRSKHITRIEAFEGDIGQYTDRNERREVISDWALSSDFDDRRALYLSQCKNPETLKQRLQKVDEDEAFSKKHSSPLQPPPKRTSTQGLEPALPNMSIKPIKSASTAPMSSAPDKQAPSSPPIDTRKDTSSPVAQTVRPEKASIQPSTSAEKINKPKSKADPAENPFITVQNRHKVRATSATIDKPTATQIIEQAIKKDYDHLELSDSQINRIKDSRLHTNKVLAIVHEAIVLYEAVECASPRYYGEKTIQDRKETFQNFLTTNQKELNNFVSKTHSHPRLQKSKQQLQKALKEHGLL